MYKLSYVDQEQCNLNQMVLTSQNLHNIDNAKGTTHMFYSITWLTPNNSINFVTTLCTWINANTLCFTTLLTVFGNVWTKLQLLNQWIMNMVSMWLAKQTQGSEHQCHWLVRHPTSKKTNTHKCKCNFATIMSISNVL